MARWARGIAIRRNQGRALVCGFKCRGASGGGLKCIASGWLRAQILLTRCEGAGAQQVELHHLQPYARGGPNA